MSITRWPSKASPGYSAAGEPVYFTLQNISEFWNVVTRPIANNGLGFSVATALGEVVKIELVLALLPDSPAI